jgi:hypothetical protein
MPYWHILYSTDRETDSGVPGEAGIYRRMKMYERQIAHIKSENKARVGYDYPERETEAKWVRSNLPKSKKEFDNLMTELDETGSYMLPAEAAAILVGTTTTVFDGEIMLCQHSYHDITTAWGVASYSDISSHKKTEYSESCAVCGAPAKINAPLGWACNEHYDDLT